MESSQSFTARRSAASTLPAFQLPPPDHLSAMHKYPAYAPPGIQTDGLSPLASSSNSGSSGSSTASVPPYQPMNYWPPQQQTSSYSFSSAPPAPSTYAQQHGFAPQRPLYSPMSSYSNRHPHSPTAGDGLPPPFDLNLPSFPTSMPSGGSLGGSLPTLAPQQQMNGCSPLLASHHSTSQAPRQSSIHAPEHYGGRPPPTPTYYTPSSTPQQSSFPAYTQQPSPSQSPNTTSAPSNRISPVSSNHPSMSAPQNYSSRFNGYLPAMAGPIMSNVHNPGNQMSLVGGMNMQYSQHGMAGQMYGHHSNQQTPQNDRPFKCDQCPQSFNRNHDLKRHKRIHLAVKPFPCGHCDKSFSRKDALKRHILVKGCGSNSKHGPMDQSGDSTSPVDKSEVLSDSTDDSPQLLKREL